jgi:excisionase family DNA binding protein
MTTRDEHEWLTEREVADRLHVSLRTVQRRVADGSFDPGVLRMSPTLVRISLAAVNEYERLSRRRPTSPE